MYVLGIDVGTGGTRALIIDEKGRMISSATEEHEPFASPQIGWAEQQPEDWWRAAAVAMRKGVWRSANLSGRSDRLRRLLRTDARRGDARRHGEVVRPALIWCDVRTEKQCHDLTEKIGADRLIQLTCNPALPNFTLTKFLWVRENEPENWRRVRSVMLPKDYVRFRLTGERAIDMADASGTLMLDVANRRWSEAKFCRLRRSMSRCCRRCTNRRTSAESFEQQERNATGLTRRHAGCRRRRRSGRRRHRHGHRYARRGERHDWNLRRRFCRDRSARARSARPSAHLLPRHSRTLARDGRDAGRRPFAALVSRSLRRRFAKTDAIPTSA